MKVIGIIPSRFDSSRFPGKALFLIDGKTMIRRVCERASACNDLSRVVVATDHPDILSQVKSFGGEAVMTATGHRSGTDRCAEALEILCRESGEEADVVVNIQGDEPFIFPEQISELVSCFSDPVVTIATLARRIMNPGEIADPNVVKLVFDHNHSALFFSRSVIPYNRTGNSTRKIAGDSIDKIYWFEHVGIYGFRPATLRQLVRLPESSLERAESLEQLRWLQNGFNIFVRETKYRNVSIDTPEDLLKISGLTG